jgi:hypothetical protein
MLPSRKTLRWRLAGEIVMHAPEPRMPLEGQVFNHRMSRRPSRGNGIDDLFSIVFLTALPARLAVDTAASRRSTGLTYCDSDFLL